MSSDPARDITEESVERRLAELLDQERFPAPEGFVPNLDAQELRDRFEADGVVGYWEAQARRLRWSREWDTALDDSDAPFFRWFTGGTINVSDNCVDRWVEAGAGDRVAFHWHGEEGEERDVTYADLHRDVQRFANVLKDRGVGKGDVVGIFLPMVPEVAVAMLACTRIGAIHNVVFGGFSASSVAERMEVSGAKLLVTVDGARRKGKVTATKAAVDEELGDLDALETIVVVRHARNDAPMRDGRDLWWDEALEAADAECPAEPLDAETPMFILYSSGSTAKPKGILHTTGGYLTGASATHAQVFDLSGGGVPGQETDDVYWCSADVGWITGHSYIVYGPLSNGATSVMWEGAPDYPHKGIWWELVARRGVTKFYTAPTAIRAAMKWGVEHVAPHDLSSLKLLGSVGEPINPKAWLWYHHVVGGERCPIVDTWWQTETGSIMITTLPGLDAPKPGSAGTPLPGVEAKVLDDDGEDVGEGEGLLALTQPWPSMLRTLYGDDERYRETYWSRFDDRTYVVGDSARRDADGNVWVIGRIDDVINVSGHRLSTAEVESVIVSHPQVAESAVVAMADELSGQAIVAYVTLQGSTEGDDELRREIDDLISRRIGKLARPKRLVWTPELPKTRSGKIMRRLLRDVAEGRDLGDTSTLADPSVVDALQEGSKRSEA